MGCAMISISRGITAASFCCKHLSIKAKLFNSALNVMSSIEVTPSAVSIKIYPHMKKTLGQLKSSDVCLFFKFVTTHKAKKSKISIFFMNIVFVIILGCL